MQGTSYKVTGYKVRMRYEQPSWFRDPRNKSFLSTRYVHYRRGRYSSTISVSIGAIAYFTEQYTDYCTDTSIR